MDESSYSGLALAKRERLEEILQEQIDSLQEMFEDQGVHYNDELWHSFKEKVNISLASEAIPSLEEMASEMLDETFLNERSDINDQYQGLLAYYHECHAFYTHEMAFIFPEMTIHIGEPGEYSDLGSMKLLISAELGHAFSDYVVTSLRSKIIDECVGEFYEQAFCWWTYPPERKNHPLHFMETSHAYHEFYSPGKNIGDMAYEAASMKYADSGLDAFEFQQKVDKARRNLEALRDNYPFPEDGEVDCHIVGGYIGWRILQGICEQTGKSEKESLPLLTMVAAKSVADLDSYDSPEAFIEDIEAALPFYLQAKDS